VLRGIEYPFSGHNILYAAGFTYSVPYWREHQKWMRHRKKIDNGRRDFVFCTLSGTPIKRFDTSWRAVCKVAGFENLHFHDLRHTFCSNLFLSGADLKDVKEMIGHKDLSMTDRYSHLTISHKLARQEELARFYSHKEADGKSSGEHIGNTEGSKQVILIKKSKLDSA
jgi:site-specific recombinase XerD